jgi:hypothetical protein
MEQMSKHHDDEATQRKTTYGYALEAKTYVPIETPDDQWMTDAGRADIANVEKTPMLIAILRWAQRRGGPPPTCN